MIKNRWIVKVRKNLKFCSNKNQIFGKIKWYYWKIKIKKKNKKNGKWDREVRNRNKIETIKNIKNRGNTSLKLQIVTGV